MMLVLEPSQKANEGYETMDHVEIAKRFIAAIDAAEPAAIRQIYAEDARIWHDFDGVEQTVDENLGLLKQLRTVMPSAHWHLGRIESLPDGFLLTYELKAIIGGKELATPACVIGTVANGRITYLQEWINAGRMMSRLSPEEQRALAG